MDFIEIKLLNYNFRFRRLSWREEFRLKIPPKADPVKVVLAHALDSVSGVKVNSVAEAMIVISPLPPAVSTRVFKIYKGSQGKARRFMTGSLYEAPQPAAIRKVFETAEEKNEQTSDKVMERMRTQFGDQELKDTQSVESQILKGAKKPGGYRGATEATKNAK